MKSTKEMFYKLYPCYFAFFVNGMMVLMIGAVLPYLIEEAGINYSVAGGLLSTFAIGNLLASFVNPWCIERIGQKKTVIILSGLIPIGLVGLTLLPPVGILYLIFIIVGIGRGSVSIFNNAIVNDENPGNPAALNILHTLFALGAFLAPFLTSLLIAMGCNWRVVVYAVTILCVLAWILYGKISTENTVNKLKAGESKKKDRKQGISYLKSGEFYIVGIILFFYLGVENCVNGWFITYFKSIGIMSEMYAANLVTIVWLFVMLGRIVTALLSKYFTAKRLILINCVGTCAFFFLLIATTNLVVITMAIVGLGYFLAGIYPTCVSEGGALIKGSSSGMSVLLAMAALGGILAPQVVGVLADTFGLTLAIAVLSISVSIMVVFAILLVCKKRGKMVS